MHACVRENGGTVRCERAAGQREREINVAREQEEDEEGNEENKKTVSFVRFRTHKRYITNTSEMIKFLRH
jgi:hypothetical protein